VIRRTVLEWQRIPYGEGDDCIPEWAADRIAEVARRSPLGGEGGARILAHGRKDLRAGQVVGVVAAEGCALEILPKIEGFGEGGGEANKGLIRRKLVHMLAVVLDIDIGAGMLTQLGWQRENLLEILIGLFARKLTDAVRQGMPRKYVAHEEDLAALRGSLDTIRQFSTLAASPQKLACRFDDLSANIALNQIMKATVRRLSRLSQSPDNQRGLRELEFAYAEIEDVPVRKLAWERVVLDRTNARWRELMNLARLILGERFQTTSLGSMDGFSLLFEMNTLFEGYIARLLSRALRDTGLRVISQGGGLYCLEEIREEGLGGRRFQTKPDILVKRGSDTLMVIDTKWKRLSPHIEDAKQGVSQGDVYQLLAYGRVYNCPRIMLLYPHHHGLGPEAGVTGQYRVAGSDDLLLTATVDIAASLRDTVASLRDLYEEAEAFEYI
jgi:5-methylcytosine-specific restriction enzyme subunit McrC